MKNNQFLPVVILAVNKETRSHDRSYIRSFFGIGEEHITNALVVTRDHYTVN